jgi:putative transcriptional regulator
MAALDAEHRHVAFAVKRDVPGVFGGFGILGIGPDAIEHPVEILGPGAFHLAIEQVYLRPVDRALRTAAAKGARIVGEIDLRGRVCRGCGNGDLRPAQPGQSRASPDASRTQKRAPPDFRRAGRTRLAAHPRSPSWLWNGRLTGRARLTRRHRDKVKYHAKLTYCYLCLTGASESLCKVSLTWCQAQLTIRGSQVNNRLKVLRAERNWSQAELAGRLGVSRQAINAIETGRFDPSLPLAFAIARLFGQAIEEIFNDGQ